MSSATAHLKNYRWSYFVMGAPTNNSINNNIQPIPNKSFLLVYCAIAENIININPAIITNGRV